MNEDFNKRWVGGVCIKDGKVLLIHRINKERVLNQEYFVFPGKNVEDDESIEDAITEEFKNHGIIGKLNDLLYSREESGDESEYYYLFDHALGEPNSTTISTDEGSEQYYTPLWIPVQELDDLMLYPESIKEHIVEKILGSDVEQQ